MKHLYTVLWCWLPFLSAAAQGGSILINEIQVANIDQHIDPSYNYGGWVELYNATSKPQSLSGWTLRHTDADGVQKQYRLTAGHGNIAPGGYKVIWFDHNSADGFYGPNAGAQVPFKMDADGGLLELQNTAGEQVEMVQYPASIARCAYRRTADGGTVWGWTSKSTPGMTNAGSPTQNRRLSAPEISQAGGLFTSEHLFQVHIPQGATLRYTTDGSTPSVTHGTISHNGQFRGTQTTIYRLLLTQEGWLDSPVVTRTFVKKNQNYTLPIICVNSAPANFFDNTIGLYVRGTNGRIANNSQTRANQNMDWERPVNIEYFCPNPTGQYSEHINQEGRFSIFGGWTRFNGKDEHWDAKPSFKLKADKVFEGKNTFDYPLFKNKPYIKIKSFLVRNGGQDQFVRLWDAAIHELIRTSGIYLDCQSWQPAHILLNGRYLGMFNLREESNKQFAFSNYGIEKEEIDQWEGDIIMKEGDRVQLNEWYNLTIQLAQHPSDQDCWQKICELVDVDEYCNYMAAEMYMGNLDWLRGGFKNIKGFRARTEDGRFHLVLHDVDGGFGNTDMILQVMKKGTGTLPRLFCNMLKHEGFRKQFIDTYCIMDGSVFSPSRCKPILEAMAATISPALQLEDTTATEKADILYQRIADDKVRRPALRKSLVEAFQLPEGYTVQLSSNIQQAQILLNGMEIPTGRFDGTLFAPISLTPVGTAGYQFLGWDINGETMETDSVLSFSEKHPLGTYEVTARYAPIADYAVAPICINEVSAGNDIYINDYGKKADWIELYNTTDKEIDLTGMYLSDDSNRHKYQIGTEGGKTLIPAHGYKIIWCDNRVPIKELHVPFKLKSADEGTISLTAQDDAWTDTICYKAQGRWQTYGRYPDGGNNLALFDRPTIATPNTVCTYTTTTPSNRMNGDTIQLPSPQEEQIVAILYYNLQGQRIANPLPRSIVIQKTVYTSGRSKSRKIMLEE